MTDFIKHIAPSQPFSLESQVDYLAGQIVSKTLFQNEHHSLTLFAFDEKEEISTHSSHGDALVTALDGEAMVTIAGEEFMVKKGGSILMPSEQPHAVYAKSPFKMSLLVIFD